MRYHSDASATVIAHRSPRETRPPVTEISSIIYSKNYLNQVFTGTIINFLGLSLIGLIERFSLQLFLQPQSIYFGLQYDRPYQPDLGID
ncbi:hypothetical protein SAMN05518871_107115 [Psychrobacillus sp. OK028]|nr:hypothetical protein SAMN05518871_107115 [Psychrobacillus sp. OK028]